MIDWCCKRRRILDYKRHVGEADLQQSTLHLDNSGFSLR